MTTRDMLFDGSAEGSLRLALAQGAGAPMDSPVLAAIARGVAADAVAEFLFALA